MKKFRLNWVSKKKYMELAKINDDLQNKIAQLEKYKFHVGAKVYITKKNYSLEPVYLIAPYNNRTCWLYHRNKDADPDMLNEINNGVHISDISFEKPQICPYCNQIIER